MELVAAERMWLSALKPQDGTAPVQREGGIMG